MKLSPSPATPHFGPQNPFFNNPLTRARTQLIQALDAHRIQRGDIHNILSQEAPDLQNSRILILTPRQYLEQMLPQFEALFISRKRPSPPIPGKEIRCWKNPEGIRYFVIEPESRYR